METNVKENFRLVKMVLCAWTEACSVSMVQETYASNCILGLFLAMNQKSLSQNHIHTLMIHQLLLNLNHTFPLLMFQLSHHIHLS